MDKPHKFKSHLYVLLIALLAGCSSTSPKSSTPWWSCTLAGDAERKLNACNSAIEANPSDGGIYYHRAVAYFEKKEYDKALVDLNKSISLGADFNEAQSLIQFINLRTGVNPKATTSNLDSADSRSKANQVDVTRSMSPNFSESKTKCTELGFKLGTEGFGKCVLQLTR